MSHQESAYQEVRLSRGCPRKKGSEEERERRSHYRSKPTVRSQAVQTLRGQKRPLAKCPRSRNKTRTGKGLPWRRHFTTRRGPEAQLDCYL